ncbi:hypothetical protein [Actinokineospora sp. HUAS TT18]|uniref:hypothetical protein n=1 Tax=Actinokineospora sp. HUAS TT18 TaxID=3447451 RepID=UPI003F51AFBC
MTYPEHDPRYQQPPAEEQVVHERVEDTAASRSRAVSMVCAVINFLCGLFAVVLVIKIVLVLADANPSNGFASFIDGFAGAVSLGFEGLFTPASDKLAALFNYGAAAIVWLLIGAALTYLIRRFAQPGAHRSVRYRRTVE